MFKHFNEVLQLLSHLNSYRETNKRKLSVQTFSQVRHKSIISVVKTLDNNIVLIIVQLTPLLIDYIRGCWLNGFMVEHSITFWMISIHKIII